MADIKQNYSVEIELLQHQNADLKEEATFLKQKVEKLEKQNVEIRLQRDPGSHQQKMEEEIAYLKQQLLEVKPTVKVDFSSLKPSLTQAEQVAVQKELAQTDMILKGYQQEC